MPGVTLDTEYQLTGQDGITTVRVTKVAVGPMSEEDAAGVARFGDLSGYATAIERLAAG
jgi:hypothetical protein